MRPLPKGFRVVSLDTDDLNYEPDRDQRSLDRLMRGLPTPKQECRIAGHIRTRNGNLVRAMAR